jgi:hypothetical protein
MHLARQDAVGGRGHGMNRPKASMRARTLKHIFCVELAQALFAAVVLGSECTLRVKPTQASYTQTETGEQGMG